MFKKIGAISFYIENQHCEIYETSKSWLFRIRLITESQPNPPSNIPFPQTSHNKKLQQLIKFYNSNIFNFPIMFSYSQSDNNNLSPSSLNNNNNMAIIINKQCIQPLIYCPQYNAQQKINNSNNKIIKIDNIQILSQCLFAILDVFVALDIDKGICCNGGCYQIREEMFFVVSDKIYYIYLPHTVLLQCNQGDRTPTKNHKKQQEYKNNINENAKRQAIIMYLKTTILDRLNKEQNVEIKAQKQIMIVLINKLIAAVNLADMRVELNYFNNIYKRVKTSNSDRDKHVININNLNNDKKMPQNKQKHSTAIHQYNKSHRRYTKKQQSQTIHQPKRFSHQKQQTKKSRQKTYRSLHHSLNINTKKYKQNKPLKTTSRTANIHMKIRLRNQDIRQHINKTSFTNFSATYSNSNNKKYQLTANSNRLNQSSFDCTVSSSKLSYAHKYRNDVNSQSWGYSTLTSDQKICSYGNKNEIESQQSKRSNKTIMNQRRCSNGSRVSSQRNLVKDQEQVGVNVSNASNVSKKQKIKEILMKNNKKKAAEIDSGKKNRKIKRQNMNGRFVPSSQELLQIDALITRGMQPLVKLTHSNNFMSEKNNFQNESNYGMNRNMMNKNNMPHDNTTNKNSISENVQHNSFFNKSMKQNVNKSIEAAKKQSRQVKEQKKEKQGKQQKQQKQVKEQKRQKKIEKQKEQQQDKQNKQGQQDKNNKIQNKEIEQYDDDIEEIVLYERINKNEIKSNTGQNKQKDNKNMETIIKDSEKSEKVSKQGGKKAQKQIDNRIQQNKSKYILNQPNNQKETIEKQKQVKQNSIRTQLTKKLNKYDYIGQTVTNMPKYLSALKQQSVFWQLPAFLLYKNYYLKRSQAVEQQLSPHQQNSHLVQYVRQNQQIKQTLISLLKATKKKAKKFIPADKKQGNNTSQLEQLMKYLNLDYASRMYDWQQFLRTIVRNYIQTLHQLRSSKTQNKVDQGNHNKYMILMAHEIQVIDAYLICRNQLFDVQQRIKIDIKNVQSMQTQKYYEKRKMHLEKVTNM